MDNEFAFANFMNAPLSIFYKNLIYKELCNLLFITHFSLFIRNVN